MNLSPLPTKPIGRTFFLDEPVRIFGTFENPEWLADDLRAILGFSAKPETMLRYHPENEKLMRLVDASGQPRKMWFVTEPGLYRLIFKSRRPEAEAFKTWVYSEVLPSLRKFGQYPPPQEHKQLEEFPEHLLEWLPADPALEGLPLRRKILIAMRLQACTEIDSAAHLSLMERCRRVSDRVNSKAQILGFSPISAYRIYRRWLRGGKDWKLVDVLYDKCGRHRR